MTNMTLALPEDLRKIMRKHDNVKWASVARDAMWAYARKLEMLDKVLSRSELTEDDVERIGKAVKRGIAKKHGL